MNEMVLTLNSPITEEQWDTLTDVDFDNTNEIHFHTKHGKEVCFVKQKIGKWIEHHEPYTWMGYTYWSCSNCGFECGYDKEIRFKTDFCPNCGAANCGLAIKGEQNEIN